MLIEVKKLNYTGTSYAPTSEDALINTSLIQSVVPVETRRTEPCVRIQFADGSTMECVGRVKDFIRKDKRDV